jgi:hypothetical protein
VVGYGPFSLYVIHKEGLCLSSGDNNDDADYDDEIYTRTYDCIAFKGQAPQFFHITLILVQYTKLIFTYMSLTLYHQRGSRHLRFFSETLTFYKKYLAMRNTADVTGDRVKTSVCYNGLDNIYKSGIEAMNELCKFMQSSLF